jgi:glycosyltransferase involved in cell wall biosynthesis
MMMGDFNDGMAVSAIGSLVRSAAVVRADLQPPMPPFSDRAVNRYRLRDRFVTRYVVGALENQATFVHELGLRSEKIDVIHTGIDVARFSDGAEDVTAVRASLGIAETAPLVGVISRLELDVWRKGITQFLEMARQVADAQPAAQFLIVGDGPARPQIERDAAALGLRDRVTFAGWRTDIPAVLQAMDVFVMPSLHEGGPTTVLEAMAAGRPVVATRVGMVPDGVAHGETGLIVDPGDADALAAAVTTLLASGCMREKLGRAARRVALDGFSSETMIERYLSVFADALGSRSAKE